MNYQSAISLLLVLANLHGYLTSRIVTTTSSKVPYLDDHLTVTCSIINAKKSADLTVWLKCPIAPRNSGGVCHENCIPVCQQSGCDPLDPLIRSSCTKIEHTDPLASQKFKNITFTYTFRNIKEIYSGQYTCKYGGEKMSTQVDVRSIVRPLTTVPPVPKTKPKDVTSRPNRSPTTKPAVKPRPTASRSDKSTPNPLRNNSVRYQDRPDSETELILGIDRQDFIFIVVLVVAFSILLNGICIIRCVIQRHYKRRIPEDRCGNKHCLRILCISKAQEDQMGLGRNMYNAGSRRNNYCSSDFNTEFEENPDQVPLRYLNNLGAVNAHEGRYPNSLNIPATDVYEDPPSPHTNGYSNGHIPGPRRAASMGRRGSANRMLKSSRAESVEIPLNRYLSLIELERQMYSGGDSAGDSSLNDEPRLPRSIRPKHRHSSQRSVRSLGAPRRREESPEDIYDTNSGSDTSRTEYLLAKENS